MKTGDLELSIVAKAVDEFLTEIRARHLEDPQSVIDEFAERYPSIADNIYDLFPALIGVEKIANRATPLASNSSQDAPSFSDYEVIREIGRGGMGIVYEARQKSLDRTVALKTLRLSPGSNPDFVERFRREAQISASLHHSNIVPVFDVGCEHDIYFFSMQYIDGVNLNEWSVAPSKEETRSKGNNINKAIEAPTIGLSQSQTKAQAASNADQNVEGNNDDFSLGPRMDPKTVARIGAQIADALDHIHSRGIIHRDIKPSNILLDKNSTAWLTDWGLVRTGFSELTQTGDLFGSLPYMAPERFKGTSDHLSDIYGLGATIYELLTQKRLFDSQDQAQLIGQIINENPSRSNMAILDIDRDFEKVILKAIDKDPSARYQTAAHFANDLRNISAGRPVSVRDLSFNEKLVKWCRRNPSLAKLSAVLASTVFIAAFTILSLLTVWNNQARLLAEKSKQQSEESMDVFFGTFFPKSGPDVGARLDPVYRKAMDDAVDEIQNDHELDPLVVGNLFNKLGWIYFNQQEYEKSLNVFGHALERVVAAHGERHEAAMYALDKIGMVLSRLNRFAEAEETLKKAWHLQSTELGAEHPSTIHSYAKLGDLFERIGRYDEAIEITRYVLNVRNHPGREDFRFVQTSLNGLALLYIQKENPEKAIEILQEVLDYRSRNNQRNLGTSYNLVNIARAYQLVGRYEEALNHVDRAIEIRRELWEANSDGMVSSILLRAAIIRDQGDLEAANQILETAWNAGSGQIRDSTKGMLFLEWGLCLKKMGLYVDAAEKLAAAKELLIKTRTTNNLYARLAETSLLELEEIPSKN